MRTRVAEMLAVEFPICAFSHCRDVVAAVSNAGGFGILGAVAHSPQRLETELTWIEEQTGGKPYGVDLLLPPKYVGVDSGGVDAQQARSLLPDEHRAFIDDLLASIFHAGGCGCGLSSGCPAVVGFRGCGVLVRPVSSGGRAFPGPVV